MTEYLCIAGIQIEVTFKSVKHIRLKVYPDGKVKVSAPIAIGIGTVKEFVQSNALWMVEHHNKLKATKSVKEREAFVERDSHYVWGKQYLVTVRETQASPYVELHNGWFRIHVKPDFTEQHRRQLVENWERETLRATIQLLITHWEPIMGVKVDRFSLQSMKTRWGSCNITQRSLRINLELIRKPEQCLEYVVVHEMVHLLERYHNKRFYGFMDRFLPDWKAREAWLYRKAAT